jgi:hypothetical protein
MKKLLERNKDLQDLARRSFEHDMARVFCKIL